MGEFRKAARIGDLATGQGKSVEIGGKTIALFSVDGNYYAIDDTCTHRGGPLSEGEVTGGKVTCPWHGATFDIRTGAVLGPPAAEGVSGYNVRVVGEDIEIEI